MMEGEGDLKSKAIVIAFLALLACACGPNVVIEPVGERNIGGQEVQVEEIQFRSGKFKVVGDLLIPAGGDHHPAIIMVHGDGPITRDDARTRTTYVPAMEIFLRNGYAVFSWDKPGSGESTGEFGRLVPQRAEILVDGVNVLAEHPAIDPARIGLWGISQAGWVMPLALEETDALAFMIVVGGGAESGVEQYAYQVGQRVACAGGSAEQAALIDQAWVQAFSTISYDEHREAMEILLSEEVVSLSTGVKLAEEKRWKPLREDNPDAFFNPVDILEHTTIPVLAFFGELDKNIDPFQGADAYEAALQKAGNQDYQVVSIPGVAHTLVPAETGCLNESWGSKLAPEYLETLESWIQHLSP
jgi:hypothetical protein